MTTTIDYKNVNEEEIKREKARKRLKDAIEKSIKSLRDIPELDEPSYEQKQFFIHKMKKGKFT